MKNHVKEGDIVLRGEAGDSESDFLAKVSGCPYSHAGIVAKNAAGDLVVVDAYPGRSSGAVAETTVDDFFCGHHATDGLVARPKDCKAAEKAAQWAMSQTSDPGYVFDLWDPWNSDPKRLYCADFVYQSFQNAGVDLAPTKTDLMDSSHRATTIAEARKMAAQDSKLAKLASDKKIEAELRKRTGGNSEYITPCQMGLNSGVTPAATLKTSASGGGGTNKP
ncbi:MAG: YiiX/YebB-like N1pC/P60 family cysteine hydrolase [Lamprobacter sp.]|uniref:YiiX/YebB-like N1pC/P60 family cysteine hydrolase n=1 Tax=Lamprobacter sp. TaxID=3100796 RepID=UPI002B25C58D|nr:YiiX/YebB-like N1pC/P60 family cysteine hydrolase [Lamprobacter sp.]MEA3643190.1 YiiX/YebB-like N1pC/P60 family cysteine hydrolase [Lamprobacter sp.]